jgi:hypothetical protein
MFSKRYYHVSAKHKSLQIETKSRKWISYFLKELKVNQERLELEIKFL